MTDRLTRVRDILTGRALDAVLITHPSNRFYLTGFTGEDVAPNESAGVLLVGADSATLLTGATNLPWAQAEARGVEVAAWERPWERTVADRIKDRGWRRVGFEDGALLVSSHRVLSEALNGSAELIPLGDAIDRLRYAKEPAELDALAAAIRLTDEVFTVATADLAPGTSERELAWRIEREMRERGADGAAFPTIVAAGPHGARPHHAPTDRVISPGEPVVIDMGANVGGYNADLTRTIWVGDPEPRLLEIYVVVARAQEAALNAIRVGANGKDIDGAARTVIEAAGYGEYFTHGLGHGLGIRVHEGPSASRTSEDTLHANEVLTVEPGIYIPDWGGVRIEDVVVVEDGGARVLTTAPKSIPAAA